MAVVGPAAGTFPVDHQDAAFAINMMKTLLAYLDDEFEKAVWGAIELHRTGLVWPLLRVWTALRPNSSAAWTMTGWAYQVDGQLDMAKSLLRRALDLDPENDAAALILGNLPSAGPRVHAPCPHVSSAIDHVSAIRGAASCVCPV